MASPFPGMDPYLEQAAFWSSFHTRLIVAIADTIAPNLRPHYYVEVETRTYKDVPDGEILIGIPDAIVLSDSSPRKQTSTASKQTIVAIERSPVPVVLPMPVDIKERYLEIRAVSDDAAITVIEILSPANKRKGKGRDTYETKRLDVLGSASHLVETDLLRAHLSLPMNSKTEPSDYYILVSVASQRPQGQLYPFSLKETFPTFQMPLKQPDESIAVDMQNIFNGVVERASYDARIDYTQPIPPPSLSTENREWVKNLLNSYKHE